MRSEALAKVTRSIYSAGYHYKLSSYIDMVSENEEYWRSPKLYLDQPDHILIIIYKIK